MKLRLLLIPLLLISSNNFGAEAALEGAGGAEVFNFAAFAQDQEDLLANLGRLVVDVPLTPQEAEAIEAAEGNARFKLRNVVAIAAVASGLTGFFANGSNGDRVMLGCLASVPAAVAGAVFECGRAGDARLELLRIQAATFKAQLGVKVDALQQFPYQTDLATPFANQDDMIRQFYQIFLGANNPYPLLTAAGQLAQLTDVIRNLALQLRHPRTFHTALPDGIGNRLDQYSLDLTTYFLNPTANNYGLLIDSQAYSTQLGQYCQAQQTYALQNQTQAALNQAQAARDAADAAALAARMDREALLNQRANERRDRGQENLFANILDRALIN